MSNFPTVTMQEFEAAIDCNDVDTVALNICCLSDFHLIRAIESNSSDVVDFLETYYQYFNASLESFYERLANLALRYGKWRAFEYFLNGGYLFNINICFPFDWSDYLRVYRAPNIFKHRVGKRYSVNNNKSRAFGVCNGWTISLRCIKKTKLQLIQKDVNALTIGIKSLILPRLLLLELCKTVAEPFSNCLTDYEICCLLGK